MKKPVEPYEFTVHFDIPGGEMESVQALIELLEKDHEDHEEH